jgi:hypothetical protein
MLLFRFFVHHGLRQRDHCDLRLPDDPTEPAPTGELASDWPLQDGHSVREHAENDGVNQE